MTSVLLGLAILAIVVVLKTIKIVPQKQAMIVERLGKYHRTAEAGLNTIVPFIDAVRDQVDLREQITKIEPQSVITRDNVTMEVDAVIYSVIVDPVRSTYEVQNLKWGIEQLTLSALRNVIGALDLDHTLTSRDAINTQLRSALDFLSCSHDPTTLCFPLGLVTAESFHLAQGACECALLCRRQGTPPSGEF